MSNLAAPLPPRIAFATTLDVHAACLCLHLQRAARAAARRFDAALRPAGLTSGQFSLLMALNRPVAPTLAPVAATLAMDRTTLTAALKPLERRGLVAVEPNPADRRARLLRLTASGHAALAAALPLWQAAEAAMESRLADPQRLRRELAGLSAAD